MRHSRDSERTFTFVIGPAGASVAPRMPPALPLTIPADAPLQAEAPERAAPVAVHHPVMLTSLIAR